MILKRSDRIRIILAKLRFWKELTFHSWLVILFLFLVWMEWNSNREFKLLIEEKQWWESTIIAERNYREADRNTITAERAKVDSLTKELIATYQRMEKILRIYENKWSKFESK